MDNEALPTDQKVYFLRNPPTINYNDGIANRRSMGWNNLIVGSHALHNGAKACVNVTNAIANYFETSLPNNIVTNYTILTQLVNIDLVYT